MRGNFIIVWKLCLYSCICSTILTSMNEKISIIYKETWTIYTFNLNKNFTQILDLQVCYFPKIWLQQIKDYKLYSFVLDSPSFFFIEKIFCDQIILHCITTKIWNGQNFYRRNNAFKRWILIVFLLEKITLNEKKIVFKKRLWLVSRAGKQMICLSRFDMLADHLSHLPQIWYAFPTLPVSYHMSESKSPSAYYFVRKVWLSSAVIATFPDFMFENWLFQKKN